MVKPLVFASAEPKASGVKPLAFPDVPTRPAQQQSNERTVQSLSFPQTSAPANHRPPPDPKPLFGEVRSPLSGDTLKYLQTHFSDMYRQHTKKFELQVSQLLPIKMDVVVAWGSKTMERMRETSNAAASLVSEFSTYDGNKLLDDAIKSIQQPSGFLSRFKQKPTDFEPQLAVLQTSLNAWMARCTTLLDAAKSNHQAVLVKMLSLSSVYEVAGEPSDQLMAQTLHSRRVLMQQGATQSELLMKQLEATYQQMVDMRMRVDQVLNVTLPAWKTASATR